MYNQTEYHIQLKATLQEFKRLKQLKGIAGDMDLSDEIRKANDLLTDLSYDWSIGIDTIFKMWGYYILHSNISTAQKEYEWNTVATFLKALEQLRTHSDYIQTNQIFFEELITSIEHEEITA